MTKVHDLITQGQSAWLDYIRRSFLLDGDLQRRVEQGVRGITSNPSIFEKAITGSNDYDSTIEHMIENSAMEIYEALAIQDIQTAADILLPIYNESNHIDGYISLEVNPNLAKDRDGTIAEARRLFAAVSRPNVMIKVPATKAGVQAIETLIGEGININVTLIFGVDQYTRVVQAYLNGLETFNGNGGDLSQVASVASFFISRIDNAVDEALDEKGNTDLKGKIAIANGALAYDKFESLFDGARWDRLALKGARVQRVLWASTSTKDPAYPDTLYVDNMVAQHTVNTMPVETLENFLDHGSVTSTLDQHIDTAKEQLKQLAEVGIDLDAITDRLLKEGLAKFANAFEGLIDGIEEKRDQLAGNGDRGKSKLETHLGAYTAVVEQALNEMRKNDIIQRLWQADYTIWQDDPTEITNRLGWLRIMEETSSNLDSIHQLVNDVRAAGYTDVLLLGMGGSSLAPEVFSRTFGTADGYLNLSVLDSTDPGTVKTYADKIDPSKTLFIVSTKSGGTAETLSFFKYFYNYTQDIVGEAEVGKHFIGITDPGSKLEKLGERLNFRTMFINDPNIGGRYSVLSYFGMVPAALLGIDVDKLLKRASQMATMCGADKPESMAAHIGAIMGELAKEGRTNLTFFSSPSLFSFGDWAEQLIAESTGKQGVGILPVVGEAPGAVGSYADDRVFVYLKLAGDNTHDELVSSLVEAGEPVLIVHLDDLYDLGGQFFLWELATAVAGQRLGINPFDQPNVESAKIRAREMLDAYQESGKLPEAEVALQDQGMTVYGDVDAGRPSDAFASFVKQPGKYIALQAYIEPTAIIGGALDALRTKLRNVTHKATTLGYGPRFLHSTGQLHKGDAGEGLFVQFTATMPEDAPIPDEAGEPHSGVTFGVLKTSQLLGDRQALLDNDRQVLYIDLGDDPIAALDLLANAL